MTMPGQAQVLSLDELVPGRQASVEFSITALQMQQFAELSGDFNPLHTDAAFARSKGFEGVVVFGALIVAKVSQLIGMRLPGRDSIWAGLTLEFRKPLYVDQVAQLEGIVVESSESTRMVSIKLTVRVAGKVIARGMAEVIVGR